MPRPSHKRKKKQRFFTGKRTATKTSRIVETRNGRVYIERMDRSRYPKITSIPCTEYVRRMLAVFKQAGGYPNYDELLFDLITSQVEAHSLPKYLLSGAKEDIELREDARHQAIAKQRYFKREVKHKHQKKIDRDTKEMIRNMAKTEQIRRKKRLRDREWGRAIRGD